MTIEEIRDKWFVEFKSMPKDQKIGAISALQFVIAVGYKGFGGDVCDFAEWLNDEIQKI